MGTILHWKLQKGAFSDVPGGGNRHPVSKSKWEKFRRSKKRGEPQVFLGETSHVRFGGVSFSYSGHRREEEIAEPQEEKKKQKLFSEGACTRAPAASGTQRTLGGEKAGSDRCA